MYSYKALSIIMSLNHNGNTHLPSNGKKNVPKNRNIFDLVLLIVFNSNGIIIQKI